VTVLRAAHISWADLFRVTVDNGGQNKLASFSKWDVIANYYDSGGAYHVKWLPYTEGAPADNQWQKSRIWLNGQAEFFEPGILNPEEELVILARVSPLPGDVTSGEIIVSTPNGVCESISFNNPGYTLLTPHSENMTISGTDYYELVEATPSDGTAMTETTDIFDSKETDRKIMYDENDSSRLARHVFPLTGISQIPPATWTVYYRCRTWGFENIKDNEVNFDIDILIRKADGTIRTTIATEVADAYLVNDEVDIWLTKSANYDFPGYTVVDDSDYLEIVYYGETEDHGPGKPGYMQIRIDDSTVAEADQTRIEA